LLFPYTILIFNFPRYHSNLQFSTIPFYSGNLPGCCTSSKNVYLALFWLVLTRPRQYTSYRHTPCCLFFLLIFIAESQKITQCQVLHACPTNMMRPQSQCIRKAFLCSLLMHFIGVNKVDSVRGTCTFKGRKVAL
jgi:hypothetical protein